MSHRLRAFAAPVIALLLFLGACGAGNSTSSDTTAAASGHADHDTESTAVAAGEPADPATATRTVDIKIVGTAMAFEPQHVQVKTGDVVSFVVANDSDLEHEFTLGDESVQTEHEEEMASHAGHGAMADDANSILLPPHTTKTLTWRFTSPGTVIYGCHVVGHYAAGMKGTVDVTA